MNERRTKPVDVSKLKDTLAQLDNDLLYALVRVAATSLNNPSAEKRTAELEDMSVDRVRVLANTAFQLRMEPDVLPDITSISQLDAALAEAGGR